ncbi:MAG TPA: ABC transporter permease [Candidatus Pullichristensenella stercorigallinarum]|uniref:ABC transporter permease n=1 Tax=Candidatus Pullichristensenella stercorigallinarum TaxID=2840909 RepID=A0A9D0ZNK3_9FIRM|nr:ABC transporter permease [Candidatus Pullichristensenella stercorigallinarum]
MRQNIVTVVFIILCALCFFLSGETPAYVAMELVDRMARNAFIVLSLIIPIVAGMGINFAITIGAMAAQIALLWVLEWQIPGIGGFLVAALMTIPIATLFGFLVGKLLNKMKGQEMIGGMILGYFANGLYQLLFLFVFGNLIPLHTDGLVIQGSTGVANTMDLSGANGIRKSLDNLISLEFAPALYLFAGIIAVVMVIFYVRKSIRLSRLIAVLAVLAACVIAVQFPAVRDIFRLVRVPVVTFAVVGVLCLFNIMIMKTRLGQQFRAVGQNRVVANAAGINVDRTRVIAIIFSTVLAGLGHLIFAQNLGALQTYGAHEQVGLYAGAAILVGGASIVKASNGQALLGCLLFHLLFIVVSGAGRAVFGDAAIGEYFRVFISYGVIAVALVMHAWSSSVKRKSPEAQLRAASEKA